MGRAALCVVGGVCLPWFRRSSASRALSMLCVIPPGVPFSVGELADGFGAGWPPQKRPSTAPPRWRGLGGYDWCKTSVCLESGLRLALGRNRF